MECLLITAILSQAIYLLMAISAWLLLSQTEIQRPSWVDANLLPLSCILIAMAGGVLYCLRAIYVNKCVRKQWDSDWDVWYVLRPITSGIAGLASYLFLNAGLLVLESEQPIDSTSYGYLTLAFIAGLNVDKFVQRLEEIAKATFGIEKSNASSKDFKKDENNES